VSRGFFVSFPYLCANVKELVPVVETLLFVAEQALSVRELVSYAQTLTLPEGVVATEETVTRALEELGERLAVDPTRIYELRAIAGGWQLLTKPAFAPYIKPVLLQKESRKLSKSALETLSIIAYRQPVAKSEIEFIRGVGSEYALQKLLEKQLIEPAGRADAPGKPLLYRTTKHLMEYLGIQSLDELPKLKELGIEDPITEVAYEPQKN
jgi:segregation and condensation protein B